MVKSVAFIWDLDGTLLDSYEAIVTSLIKTYEEHGFILDKNVVYQEVISSSVSTFIKKMESETGLSYDDLKDRNSEISAREKDKINLIKHAEETLAELQKCGAKHYVFTHRGISSYELLKKHGIEGYFEEIIIGISGFPRKPDPSAINYLVQKYHLDMANTYYVGDRHLDIEAAKNAGIKSILFLSHGNLISPTGKETFVVDDLREIKVKIFGY